jgi:hypothetical protein
MRKLLALALFAITSGIGSGSEANALDEHGLAAIQTAVHNICVQPDQKGNYLKIDGDLNGNATLKIEGVSDAGKITKEAWDGISQKLDQYKTDPRQCAMSIVPILVAAMDAALGRQGALERQNEFLHSVSVDTPLEKIKEIYGCPTKELNSSNGGLKLQIYDGLQHKFLIVLKNNKNIGKFAIFKTVDEEAEKAADVHFPIIWDAFDHFTLTNLAKECDGVSPYGADARFLVFITTACYFGRPGGYQYYQFGYEAGFPEPKCKTDPFDWNGKISFNKLMCNKDFMDHHPNFVFSSPDENDDLGIRLYYVMYWWDEHTF